MVSIGFDYAHYCGCLEVRNKHVNVLLVTQIVTAREKVLDLQLVVKHAKGPQILAQAGLGSELTIIGEMIVPLVPTHVLESALLVRDVISNVELLDFASMLNELPSKLKHATADIRLNSNNLTDYRLRLRLVLCLVGLLFLNNL